MYWEEVKTLYGGGGEPHYLLNSAPTLQIRNSRLPNQHTPLVSRAPPSLSKQQFKHYLPSSGNSSPDILPQLIKTKSLNFYKNQVLKALKHVLSKGNRKDPS